MLRVMWPQLSILKRPTETKPRAPVLGVQSLSHLDHQESPKVLVSNDCEFLLLLLCKLDCLGMKEEIAGEANQGYGGRGESDLHSDLNLLAVCVWFWAGYIISLSLFLHLFLSTDCILDLELSFNICFPFLKLYSLKSAGLCFFFLFFCLSLFSLFSTYLVSNKTITQILYTFL